MVDAQKTVSTHAPFWGVATFENENDRGMPLLSYLRCIPQLDAVMRSNPGQAVVPDLIRRFPGVKVEGLAKSPFGTAWAIVGTDDEDLGEMVRPISRP